MAACGEPGEDAALYATVKAVGMELCPRWASPSPWARTACPCARSGRTAGKKKVTSPVSLIVSAFASLADVRGTLTPQLDATETTPRWC
jgi:phosphoribosylformylglycinamidine synthase